MILLVSFFKTKIEERHKELKDCILQNCLLQCIEKIYVFIENINENELKEEKFLFLQNNKIRLINIEKRPSYKTFIDFANNNLHGNICIVANTDILFDNSLELVNKVDFDNKMMAVTRHNVEGDNLVLQGGGVMGSQDSWIFKSPIKPFNNDIVMGIDGCDSYFAQKASEAGISVINPCYSIITVHKHSVGERNASLDNFIYWHVGDYGSFCVQPSSL